MGGGRGGKAEKVHFITYCPGGDWRGCARWKFSVVYCPEAIGQAEGSFLYNFFGIKFFHLSLVILIFDCCLNLSNYKV